MNISKDEARILAAALSSAKYEIVDNVPARFPELRNQAYAKLEELENKLDNFSFDKRRVGRRTFNEFSDLLKRFASEK